MPEAGVQAALDDYVGRELVRGQPVMNEVFLQDTSIFPVLIPDACDRLRGVDNSSSVLEDLKRTNVVTETQLVTGQSAYILHDAVRGRFLEQLKVAVGEEITLVGSRAGALLEDVGLDQEALDVYETTGSYEAAARLLDRVSDEMALNGHWAALAEMVDRIPLSVTVSVPKLAIRRAHAAMVLGDTVLARKLLFGLSDSRPAGLDDLMPWFLLEQSNLATITGDLDKAKGLANRAKALIEGSVFSYRIVAQGYHAHGVIHANWRQMEQAEASLELAVQATASSPDLVAMEGKILNDLGTLHTELGNLARGQRFHQMAIQKLESVEDEFGRAMALNNIANCHYMLSQFDEAESILVSVIAEERERNLLREESYAQATLGDVYRATARPGEAESCYERSLSLGRLIGDQRIEHYALDGLVMAYVFTDRTVLAQEFLGEAVRLASKPGMGWQLGRVQITGAYLQLRQGDNAAAMDVIEKAVDSLSDYGTAMFTDLCRALLLAVYIGEESGSRVAATDYLGRLVDLVKTCNRRLPFLAAEVAQLPELAEILDRPPELKPYADLAAYSNRFRVRNSIRWNEDESPDLAVGSSHVEIRSLGDLSIKVNGEIKPPKAFGGLKVMEMAVFIAYARRPLAWKEIAGGMGSDEPDDADRNRVKQYVNRARQVLGKQPLGHSWLITEGGKYEFRPQGHFEMDARTFNRAIKAAIGLPPGAANRISALEDAIELYQGPFMPGFDAKWCADERARLEFSFFSVAYEVADYHFENENYYKVVATAERILEQDPSNEEGIRYLTMAYKAMGDVPTGQERLKLFAELNNDWEDVDSAFSAARPEQTKNAGELASRSV